MNYIRFYFIMNLNMMNTDFIQYNDKFYINYLKIVHERNMAIICFYGALLH